uniref:Uncharacterized protein n=1 Tax=Anguilla anguilla TaxID=7936 RepID=A0A0E9S442_ANGAN
MKSARHSVLFRWSNCLNKYVVISKRVWYVVVSPFVGFCPLLELTLV